MEDFRKIMVGDQQVGILGLQRILAEVKRLCGDESDERISAMLLEKLSTTNYISDGHKQAYELAFLREYKKFIGKAVPEESKKGLTIRVLGQGCPLCRRLGNEIMEILAERNMVCDFEHVTDLQEIVRYGVFATPALIINDQLKSAGKVPSRKDIENWLRQESKS